MELKLFQVPLGYGSLRHYRNLLCSVHLVRSNFSEMCFPLITGKSYLVAPVLLIIMKYNVVIFLLRMKPLGRSVSVPEIFGMNSDINYVTRT